MVRALAIETAASRPWPGGDVVVYATKVALRVLGGRVLALDDELVRLDSLLEDIVTVAAPELLAVYGIGVDTCARCWSPPATTLVGFAPKRRGRTCAVLLPIEASSGKVVRHRLDRGGDRHANQALWRIVMVRMANDLRTRTYVERRTKEGRSKREIIRVPQALRSTRRSTRSDLDREFSRGGSGPSDT